MDLVYRYNPYEPIVCQRPGSAQAACDALLAGNERFVRFVGDMQSATLADGPSSEVVIPVDLITLGLPLIPGTTLDQRPFALVLGCSDARVPVEQVFDRSFNDLFVVRIAGNVLGTECLGSYDYAVRAFADSLKLVVVLGHSGCGAVTAAVDAYLSPSEYANIAFTHSLRSLVDRVGIAVRGAARALEHDLGHEIRHHPNYRRAMIDCAVYLNAAITSFDLWREATLTGASIEVKYGVCDLSTLLVRAMPPSPQDRVGAIEPSLGDAPEHAEDFVALASAFVERVVATGILS